MRVLWSSAFRDGRYYLSEWDLQDGHGLQTWIVFHHGEVHRAASKGELLSVNPDLRKCRHDILLRMMHACAMPRGLPHYLLVGNPQEVLDSMIWSQA